jgi:protein involved in sex pheromone biosynthesis
MKRTFPFVLAVTYLLAGCSNSGGTPAGGVTQSESDALNDAAAVIDDANKAVADGAAKPQ